MHKGQGPEYDYLHLHYRSTATLLAMGADPIDTLRQMKNTATDPYSAGRNFCNHYSVRKWNVAPVSSPIEVQFSMAPGTALANKRAGGKGITIVQGGDAGTAEGDFATCLIWCSRPRRELPCLMIVTNNQWGISTPASEQHGEKHIADRGKAFGIKSAVIDGNDPEACYRELKKAMDYVRTRAEAVPARGDGVAALRALVGVGRELRPRRGRLPARPSRRSSRSGSIMTRAAMDELRAKYTQQLLEASKRVREEPQPKGEDIWKHVFAERDASRARARCGLEERGALMATIVQAIRLALHVGEERLGVTDIFGEDVGPPLGGVFTQTQGLKTAWNSPLDERGIVGTAIGLALAGQRPVAEIQFCDYAFNMIDLLKLAGGICWSSAGDWNCPMVLMTPVGSGIRGSIYHSHSFDAQATRIPGWKIVMPSNPLDAYGLMLSAILDPNPVMYLAPKALLRAKAGAGRAHPRRAGRRARALEDDRRAARRPLEVAARVARREGPASCPSARRASCREGSDVTRRHLRAHGAGRDAGGRAARARRHRGRGHRPALARTRTTGTRSRPASRRRSRVLFVNEDTEVTNFGEHLLRRTVEELFYELDAPPKLLAGRARPGHRPRRRPRARERSADRPGRRSPSASSRSTSRRAPCPQTGG